MALNRCIEVTYNKAPESEVMNFFSKFGVVKRMTTVFEKEPSEREYVKKIYIIYDKPENVRSVFLNRYYVNNEYVFVRRIDYFHMLSITDFDVKGNKKNITSKGFNILQLPEFCLEAIFEHLDLVDLMNLAQSHKKFYTSFETFSRRKYKIFDVETAKLLFAQYSDMRNFFTIAGKYMVEISNNLHDDYINDILMDFCPNLEKITFTEMQGNCYSFNNLVHKLRHLREVNISDYFLEFNPFAALWDAHELRTLNLSSVHNINGANIKTLTQLEHLSLHRCSRIQSTDLIDICRALQNLRSLDISGIFMNDSCFYDVIDKHCQKLELLKMTEPRYSYKRVALLPRLKHFEIIAKNNLTIISDLVQHMANQLEVLKIYRKHCLTYGDVMMLSELCALKVLSIAFNQAVVTDVGLTHFSKLTQLEDLTIAACYNVTNFGLLELLRKCPRLRILNIQYCDRITNDFITDVALLATARRKFTIYTCGTAVEKAQVLQCPAYREAHGRFGFKVEFQFTEAGLTDFGRDIHSLLKEEVQGRRNLALNAQN